MSRISRVAWAMGVAQLTARRSTCLRRQVGCVLLNAQGHVLATGYNGVASGMPHCNERVLGTQEASGIEGLAARAVTWPHACPGADAPSGQNLDGCHAIHAEQNALLQCKDPYQIDACFVTASPCMTCTKLLLNTSCRTIVFAEQYPHSESEKLWLSAGRKWVRYQD